MSWLFDLHPAEEPELVNAFLLSAGKALCLAQGFEAKCRYVLGIVALTDAIKDGHEFDAACALAKCVADKTLCKTIHLIRKSWATDLPLLIAAKDARNYIAHEGALIYSVSDIQAVHVLELFRKLELRVVDLAKGDNLVSAWCYEIAEKEHAPSRWQASYEEMILQWVFDGSPRQPDGSWEYVSTSATRRPRNTAELVAFLEARLATPAVRSTERTVG